MTGLDPSKIPVPIIQPAERTGQVAQQAQSGANQLLATLSSPQNIQILTFLIGAFIVLLLLFTVRKGVKNPAVKSPAAKTPEKKG